MNHHFACDKFFYYGHVNMQILSSFYLGEAILLVGLLWKAVLLTSWQTCVTCFARVDHRPIKISPIFKIDLFNTSYEKSNTKLYISWWSLATVSQALDCFYELDLNKLWSCFWLSHSKTPFICPNMSLFSLLHLRAQLSFQTFVLYVVVVPISILFHIF